jgi:hypothetical protein
MQLRPCGEARRLGHVGRQMFRELHASFGVTAAAAAEASDDEGVAMIDAVAATRQWKWTGAESVYLYGSVSRWTSAELRTWQATQETSRLRFNMEVEELNFMTFSVSCMKRSTSRMS